MTQGTEEGGGRSDETLSILVVDDEADICQSILTFIEGSMPNATVRSERNASDALSYLEAYPVDLIITDYRMPDVNGLEFLRAARELRGETPRIMMTAYPDLDLAMQAINEEKVDAFLTKPLEPLDLVQTVRTTLREHRHRRSSAVADT